MTRLNKRKLEILKYPLNDSPRDLERLTGIPNETISKWLRDEEFIALKEEQKKLAWISLNQEAQEIIRNEIKPRQTKSKESAILALGIIIDKMAVLAGENNKWSANNVNIGDNRKIEIKISSEAESLVKRGK